MEPPKTFASKLGSWGRAAFNETKRSAQLASLKAQIEKLKLVELKKAHHTLGKRAFELKSHPETFGPQYDAIAELEKDIATKREGVPANHKSSSMQLFKDAAVSMGMKVEAEATQVKLTLQYVALGQHLDQIETPAELMPEQSALNSVKFQIESLEKQYTELSAAHPKTAED